MIKLYKKKIKLNSVLNLKMDKINYLNGHRKKLKNNNKKNLLDFHKNYNNVKKNMNQIHHLASLRNKVQFLVYIVVKLNLILKRKII